MTEDILTKISPSRGEGSPEVTGFYDEATGSCQYICVDLATKKAALIDVVQSFDPKSFATNHNPGQFALDFLNEHNLTLDWILDTHPHADHFMASAWLKEQTGVRNGIGEKVKEIAGLWRDLYNLPKAFDPDRDFDRLFADGDGFNIGELDVKVMLSPGHTLGSITYVIGDAIFAHDTLMQPDAGTSRCDFPGGSASQLYDSIMAILALPDEHRIFIGHDYGTKDRDEPAWESTVAEQKRDNIHVGADASKEDYVKRREERDATLALPNRMLAALQVNLRAGHLPPQENDGHSYLKMPLNKF